MRFTPDFKLQIIEDRQFDEQILNVEETLKMHKNSGYFSAFDNTEIYYEYFLCENARANVVIVHGLSEFTKKFYELSFYLLNQGYNVFLYDQRCHGLSGRLTDDIQLLHVDSFNDYVADLEQFIDEIIIPVENKPLYLYSHSMGGAITSLYLAKNQDKVQKAVLTAPMFQPIVKSVPEYVARASVRLCKALIGPEKRFFQSKNFDPNVQYSAHHGTSEVRFNYNLNLRKGNENYQSSPMSFSWVLNSLTVKNTILKDKFIQKIKTPILIISAEKDNTVKNEPQRLFAQKCNSCEFLEIGNETHSLLASNSKTLEYIVRTVLNFYND